MYEIPKVLKPIRIGNVLLKNRIVSAPTTMHSLSNGEPSLNPAPAPGSAWSPWPVSR